MKEAHSVISHCKIFKWGYTEQQHEMSGVKKLGNIPSNGGIEKNTEHFPHQMFIR